jgi:tol-pal system protein YbgF
MVIRSSSTPGFRFAQIRRRRGWLPLVALLLLAFGASAAVETTPVDRDGLGELQTESSTRFVALQEEQGDLAENYQRLQTGQQRLRDGLSVMLAQVQTVRDEQPVSGLKLAQAEPAPAPSNRGVVQLLNQVEALNGELNRLRGQMEVLSNDINNAQKRQRDMYIDLDTRLRRIEQGGAGKKDQDNVSVLEERIRKLEQGSATPATIPQPVVPAAAVPPVNPPPPAAATAVTPTAAAAATAPTSVNPVAAAASPSNSLPPASLTATDQAAVQRAYDNAYSNYRLSDYLSAIRGFDSFLKSFPKHPLAPNAQYWIGESYSHLHQYREAIETERRLLGTYPDSAKAPDALLIIGTAESSLGDNPAARKTFEELIAKYPASDAADKAKGRLAKLK